MTTSKRRPFSLKRLGLRSLMIFVTVACIVVAIWTSHVQPFRDQLTSMQMVTRLNGNLKTQPFESAFWQRWLLEDDALQWVNEVDLTDANFESGDPENFAAMTQLESLDLKRSNISDDDLAALARLSELRELSLNYCKISDAGMKNLGKKPELTTLRLTTCDVSDASIDQITDCPNLKTLFIRWTAITPEGVDKIRERLPDCEVFHRPRREADN